jgi:hypothetical protein
VRAAFAREVIADAPAQIAAAADELIDWIAEREHRLVQDINEYLARRRQGAASALGSPGEGGDEHVIGGIGASFDFNRRAVLQRVTTAVDRAVRSYDRDEETRQLAGSLQGAVVASAAAGVGAVGLGVGVAVLVGTAAADITGITAAVVLGGLGLGVLPLQRARAKRQFDAKTRELSEKLATTLREQFERELEAGAQRLREALAPYTRFVRLERERVAQAQAALDRISAEAEALRQRIESGTSASKQEVLPAENLTPPAGLAEAAV